jgi:predicted adenylyl cyclase CyaB
MIEAEIRSFITEEQYEQFIELFKSKGKFLGDDEQVTYYFDCEEDLRIQRNNNYSKIWMKKGKMHDEQREEIEIKFAKEDFEVLEKLFLSLGYNVKIKWFRKRHNFEWNNISISVDFTRGYGYIIEFERLCEENEKEEVLSELKKRFSELGIVQSSKEEFDKQFNYYKENWQKLV